MRTIHKHPLPIGGRWEMALPVDAKVLHVDLQDGAPMMWVLLDDEESKVNRSFSCYGTGQEIPLEAELEHLGTLMMLNGVYVWHFFEETRLLYREAE